MNARLLVSGSVAGVLLLAFGALFDPAAVLATLERVDLATFAVCLAATVAALGLWSEGLRGLLSSTGVSASPWRTVVAYGTGTAGKLLLPMGNAGGPALLAYAVSRDVELPYERTLAVVTVSELLTLVGTLLLAALGLAFTLAFRSTAGDVYALAVVLVAVFGAVCAAVLVVATRRAFVERAVGAAARLLDRALGDRSPALRRRLEPERVRGSVRAYYETVDAVARRPRALGRAFLFGLAGRICFALPLSVGAFALDLRVPVLVAFLVVAASSVAAVVPLPGGLGSVELVLVGLLVSLTGLDATHAVAVVVLYRLSTYWFLALVGALASVYSVTTVRSLPTAVADAEPDTDVEAD